MEVILFWDHKMQLQELQKCGPTFGSQSGKTGNRDFLISVATNKLRFALVLRITIAFALVLRFMRHRDFFLIILIIIKFNNIIFFK